MAYNWSTWDAENKQQVPIFFKCRIYARIDNLGNVKVYKYGNIPPPNAHYFKTQVSPLLIREIDSVGKYVKTETIDSLYRSPHSGIYDGPILQIGINYDGNEPLLYHFIDDKVFMQFIPSMITLHHRIHEIKGPESTIDTMGFNKDMLNFIKRVITLDTTRNDFLRPPIRVLFNNKILKSREIF